MLFFTTDGSELARFKKQKAREVESIFIQDFIERKKALLILPQVSRMPVPPYQGMNYRIMGSRTWNVIG